MQEMGAPISLDGVAVHLDCWCICQCYLHFALQKLEDGKMYLLVSAHPGCPRQSPESCKMVVCVCGLWLTVVLDVQIKKYVGWQEGHPACKKLSGGCWHGYLSGARCRFAYGPADAPATPSSCSSKFRLVLPEWFCFSGAGLPGLSWKKGC